MILLFLPFQTKIFEIQPIFVETDINNFNMDINKIEKLISKKTK